LIGTVDVEDRAAAFLLERRILDAYARWLTAVTAHHFPRGGRTECWSMLAARPTFRVELHAPGFQPTGADPLSAVRAD
jgi:hypothetical protein